MNHQRTLKILFISRQWLKQNLLHSTVILARVFHRAFAHFLSKKDFAVSQENLSQCSGGLTFPLHC